MLDKLTGAVVDGLNGVLNYGMKGFEYVQHATEDVAECSYKAPVVLYNKITSTNMNDLTNVANLALNGFKSVDVAQKAMFLGCMILGVGTTVIGTKLFLRNSGKRRIIGNIVGTGGVALLVGTLKEAVKAGVFSQQAS